MTQETWRDRLQKALDESEMSVAELMRRAGTKGTQWHDMMVRDGEAWQRACRDA